MTEKCLNNYFFLHLHKYLMIYCITFAYAHHVLVKISLRHKSSLYCGTILGVKLEDVMICLSNLIKKILTGWFFGLVDAMSESEWIRKRLSDLEPWWNERMTSLSYLWSMHKWQPRPEDILLSFIPSKIWCPHWSFFLIPQIVFSFPDLPWKLTCHFCRPHMLFPSQSLTTYQLN